MTVNVKNTRAVTVTSDKRTLTITANDADPKSVTISVSNYSSRAEITMSRDEFLDAIVASWPESVAYQFKKDER